MPQMASQGLMVPVVKASPGGWLAWVEDTTRGPGRVWPGVRLYRAPSPEGYLLGRAGLPGPRRAGCRQRSARLRDALARL